MRQGESASFLSERVKALIRLDYSSETVYSVQSHPFLSIYKTIGDTSPLSGIHAFCREAHDYIGIQASSLMDTNAFEWLLYPSEWNKLISSHPFNDMDVREPLLWMTMDLERSLGNILFTLNVKVPHLLRDILQNESLLESIGGVHGEILGCLLGSPDTLNIRNLIWHGFASPDELHPAYVSAILIVSLSIGHRLLNNSLRLRRRQFSLNLERCSSFRQSEDINDLGGSHPGMNRILDLYAEGKYDLSLMLFLPHLESTLRLLYTQVNDCPLRLLTAESDQFYTTFDEIFAPEVSVENEAPQVNQVRKHIGDPLLEFYYDIFILPEGPRVRDRLSHGEFQIFSNIKAFKAPLTLLLRSILFPKDFDSYKSIFHPFSLLFQRVSEATDEILGSGGRIDLQTSILSNTIEYTCLFRPKSELELVRILNQIASVIRSSAVSMNENRRLTLDKMNSKSLRSRQRLTAERMFSCMDTLKRAQMETLSYLLIVFGSRDVIAFDLRSLRRILSIHQNINTWVKTSENHWDRVRSALMDLTKLLRYSDCHLN